MLQAQLRGGKKLLLSNLGSLVWAAANQGHSISGERLCKDIREAESTGEHISPPSGPAWLHAPALGGNHS